MPTKPGTYIGFARSAAVEQREGKCPRWVAVFQLGQYFNGTDWEPVNGDMSITGYFTLINKNGQPNDINCQAIIEAYQLPQFDFKTLESFDFAGTEVQLVIDYRDFEKDGQTKRVLDIAYLNPRNHERQTLVSDPVVVQSLDAKYGALLRAKFKVKPHANGSATPKTATASPADAALASAKQSAWTEFKTKTPTMTPDQRNGAFKDTAKGYGGGKEPSLLTADDWRTVAAQIGESGPWQPNATPVAPDGGVIQDDDIPF